MATQIKTAIAKMINHCQSRAPRMTSISELSLRLFRIKVAFSSSLRFCFRIMLFVTAVMIVLEVCCCVFTSARRFTICFDA